MVRPIGPGCGDGRTVRRVVPIRFRAGGTPALTTISLAQAQSGDDGLITATIGLTEILEQTGAFAHHLEEATPAGVVLLVETDVLVKLVDASGQEGDLHLRRPGVVLLAPERIND